MRLVTGKRKVVAPSQKTGWVKILTYCYYKPNSYGAIVKVLDRKCDYEGGVVVTGVPGTVLHLEPKEFTFVQEPEIDF